MDLDNASARWSRGWAYRIGLVLLAALAALVTVVAVVRSAPAVTLDEHACGAHWAGPVAGRHTVTLVDAARDPVDVYVIDPASNLVYADDRNVIPGLKRPLGTTLGSGRYALRCVFTNGIVLTSRAHTLRTAATGVEGIPPMPDLALQGPVTAYRTYVQNNLPVLRNAAIVLASDVAHGELAKARIDWLTAHLDYERLGAAYNTFGDFDGAIDGTVDGLPRGVNDPSWTGFFRIEYGLWHGQNEAVLRPVTRRLVTDVDGLIADFPSEDTDPVDLPLRSHEILENALEFQVSGADDDGSGTTLATAYANTQGTLAVLSTITDLIDVRDPALLSTITAQIATVQADLMGCRTAAGTWLAVTALAQRQRQQLDGDLGALLEQLANIPNLLAERTSA